MERTENLPTERTRNKLRLEEISAKQTWRSVSETCSDARVRRSTGESKTRLTGFLKRQSATRFSFPGRYWISVENSEMKLR